MLNDQWTPNETPNYTAIKINRDEVQSCYQISLKRRWRRLSRFQRIIVTLLGILILVCLGVYWQKSAPEQPNLEKIFEKDFHKHLHHPDNLELQPIKEKPIKKIEEIKIPKKLPRAPGDSKKSEAIVEALRHTWEAYRRYAWGKDEILVLSKTSSTWMDAALTMIDSLDTLWIMGLRKEFYEARDWIEKNLSFNNDNDRVNVFETVIRVLGGLLSAHVFSGEKVFLDKARDLGDRILPAFDTPSGISYSDINLATKEGHQPAWTPMSSLSEATSIQLEFNELSRLTGDDKYSKAGMKALETVLAEVKFDGLAPIFINVNTGKFQKDGTITFGARGDSYYEYLLKVWIQRGKKDDHLKKAYVSSIKGLKRHLLRRSKPNGLLYVGELLSGRTFSSKMDHLVCFLPGTLAYGVLHGMPSNHLTIAKELARSCNEMYVQMPTGLSPEIVYFNSNDEGKDINVQANDAYNLQRPETIESFYYLYKITGDPIYQNWGWNIFQAFQRYTRIEPYGYVGISDVADGSNVGQKDKCESFWIAETLKYFYLLFNEDNKLLPLTKYVFNTEGHPFPIKN